MKVRMKWTLSTWVAVVLGGLFLATLAWAQIHHPTTELWDFKRGFQVNGITVMAPSGSSLAIGNASSTSVVITGSTGILTVKAQGSIVTAPAAQTIASGGTIAADACGGLKLITAAGAVTTSTTNTITAPAAANAGCVMVIVNSGANTITLDVNTNIKLQGGADVALLANSAITVVSDGTFWRQVTAQQTST